MLKPKLVSDEVAASVIGTGRKHQYMWLIHICSKALGRKGKLKKAKKVEGYFSRAVMPQFYKKDRKF